MEVSTCFKSLSRLLPAGSVAVLMVLTIVTRPTPANAQANSPTQTSAPVTAPSEQVPQPSEGGVDWEGVSYGVGAPAADVVYVPAKFLYAISGVLIGGGAYVLTGGNTQTANAIWRSSLGGDYVVTLDMVAGKEPVHFSGPTDTAPLPPASTVQPIGALPGAVNPAPQASTSNLAIVTTAK